MVNESTLCPSPEDLLLKHVQENDTNSIHSLVRNTDKNILNHVYSYPYNRPILHIACLDFSDTVEKSTVKTLVALGADLFFSQDCDNHKQALHLAAESTNPEILEAVVDCLKRHQKGSVNCVDGNGNTALHTLVKVGEPKTLDFVKCAEVLVKNGIDVNKGDGKNHSAVLLAAKEGYGELVKFLVAQKGVDLDNHKIRGKSARDWIEKNQLLCDLSGETKNNNVSGKEALFACLKEGRVKDFLSFPNAEEYVDADDESNTVLQLACKKGYAKAVEFLLNNRADPNHTCPLNLKRPLEITSESGFHDIFHLLLEHPKIQTSEEVVCNLLKYINTPAMGNIDFKKCLELLRGKLKTLNLNYKDAYGNAPLHYAVMYAEPDAILSLLESGSSLASRNNFGILPIHDIEASVLEKHLDRCIETSKPNMPQNKEQFTVTFKYNTLIPPQKVAVALEGLDLEKNPLRDVMDLVAETEVVAYMSQSLELKRLLTHPVITSFLFMKWQRVCWFFYTNLAFYLTFWLSLILYVSLFYSNDSGTRSSTLSVILQSILCITSVLLMVRELFQIFVSPKTYFLGFENWVEICLIILSFSILFEKSHGEDTRKQLSAFVVLLSTFEFVLLVGQHPKICTNVVILRTVSFNFFKFLLWFSILIVAFAFSFYVLFNTTQHDSPVNATNTGEQDFFNDPTLSMIKTIVMLTGELDASSINFQTFPLASRLIFLMFVFTITIIVFNLLNGLAVSDTTMIKSDAELVGLVAQVEHIAYIENMILGNLLPSTICGVVNKICCCLPQMNTTFRIPTSFAEKVCLFPNFLQNYSLEFYPNKFGEVTSERPSKCRQLSKIYLDKKTVRRTSRILQERKRKEENGADGLLKMYNSLKMEVEENTNVILQRLERLDALLQSKQQIL